jgi:hypothetical protein
LPRFPSRNREVLSLDALQPAESTRGPAGVSVSSQATALWGIGKELTFTPFHENGIYKLGEKVGWTVTRTAETPGVDRFTYVIRKNGLEVLRNGTIDLFSGKGTIEEVVSEPCMIYLQLTPEGTPEPPMDPQKPPYASAGAAVAPELIQPSSASEPALRFTVVTPLTGCPRSGLGDSVMEDFQDSTGPPCAYLS